MEKFIGESSSRSGAIFPVGFSPQYSKELGMHRDSHAISKPKIRIIHIVAPKIIKTDVENFRCLVQRLTGNKSAAGVKGRRKNVVANNKGGIIRSSDWTNIQPQASQDHHHHRILQGTQRIKGAFGGFGDMNINLQVQDLSSQFALQVQPLKLSQPQLIQNMMMCGETLFC